MTLPVMLRANTSRWPVIGLALMITLVVGCDKDSPTGPDGPLLPDFDCQEVSPCSLTCTDRTTGGRRPYLLLWQADEQAPNSVVNPTFTWDFSSTELVRVRLTVTDDNGEGTREGPVERPFEICAKNSATSAEPPVHDVEYDGPNFTPTAGSRKNDRLFEVANDDI